MQREAGGERRVECEMHGVAFGDEARRLSELRPGSTLRFEGFLARRYREGPAVALHITSIESKSRD